MKNSPAVKLTRQRQKEFSAKTQFKETDDSLTMLAKLAYKTDRHGKLDPRIIEFIETGKRPA
ncbi:hypothetical protein [Corynebacterium flavescens]|uniref:hypothetical protein n=1 Tax=Corynebacterium flavescens TaxID=28028 RepID=UPI003FD51213